MTPTRPWSTSERRRPTEPGSINRTGLSRPVRICGVLNVGTCSGRPWRHEGGLHGAGSPPPDVFRADGDPVRGDAGRRLRTGRQPQRRRFPAGPVQDIRLPCRTDPRSGRERPDSVPQLLEAAAPLRAVDPAARAQRRRNAERPCRPPARGNGLSPRGRQHRALPPHLPRLGMGQHPARTLQVLDRPGADHGSDDGRAAGRRAARRGSFTRARALGVAPVPDVRLRMLRRRRLSRRFPDRCRSAPARCRGPSPALPDRPGIRVGRPRPAGSRT